MTTFLEQPDQAAVDLKRRDEWRLTLDREVQMNTMQIEAMQQTVSRPAVAGGIAGELQQFIARRGWEIGYATMSGVVKRWDSFREWVEDYPDNGGLNTTVAKVLPYVCQVEVKANAVQHKAIKSLMTALDPVDRLAIRPDAADSGSDWGRRDRGPDPRRDEAESRPKNGRNYRIHQHDFTPTPSKAPGSSCGLMPLTPSGVSATARITPYAKRHGLQSSRARCRQRRPHPLRAAEARAAHVTST